MKTFIGDITFLLIIVSENLELFVSLYKRM